MKNEGLVITTGDPAGCGPYVSLKALDEISLKGVDVYLVGDEKILRDYFLYSKLKKKINLVDLKTKDIDKVKPGFISKLSGKASLSYIDKALELIKELNIKRLITAPVSKEAIQYNIKNFSGHTEYLASYFKSDNIVMMMHSKQIATVLLTRHIPLREVSKSLREKEIAATLELVYESLKNKFKIKNPKIVFASLNPHAGVDTFFDKEEQIIAEAIKKSLVPAAGPYPSDTIFIKEKLKKYDCIICLYHDQAMIPFKLLSLKSGVNLTLGLPIIRTSPAHGVASDIIRAKKPLFYSSMLEAIKLNLKLTL